MVLVDYIGIFLHVAILLATYCVESKNNMQTKMKSVKYTLGQNKGV